MNRRRYHGLAAALLVAGGLVFVFTTSVAAAVGGLGLVLAAAICLLLGRRAG